MSYIADKWLRGYRDGSSEVPEELLDDQEYLEGYSIGLRHVQNKISMLGKRKSVTSIFQFDDDT